MKTGRPKTYNWDLLVENKRLFVQSAPNEDLEYLRDKVRSSFLHYRKKRPELHQFSASVRRVTEGAAGVVIELRTI